VHSVTHGRLHDDVAGTRATSGRNCLAAIVLMASMGGSPVRLTTTPSMRLLHKTRLSSQLPWCADALLSPLSLSFSHYFLLARSLPTTHLQPEQATSHRNKQPPTLTCNLSPLQATSRLLRERSTCTGVPNASFLFYHVVSMASSILKAGQFKPGSKEWGTIPCDIMHQPVDMPTCAQNVEPGGPGPYLWNGV
jgi:hypothetical protein